MFSFLDAHALGENTVLSDMLSRLERPTYVNEKKKKKTTTSRPPFIRKKIKATNYGAEQQNFRTKLKEFFLFLSAKLYESSLNIITLRI